MTEEAKNKQVEWVVDGDGDTRRYRSMVIGWQNVIYTINVLVEKFNSELLDQEEDTPNEPMREVAIKKLIIGALFELEICIGIWTNELRKCGLFTGDLVDKKREIRKTFKEVKKFKDIRNKIGFHFDDPYLDPTSLLSLYEKVDGFSLDYLNHMLRSIIKLGEAFKEVILPKTG